MIAHRTADGLGIPVAEGIEVVRDKDSRYASTAPQYRRTPHAFPDDFPHRLERFKKDSGLSWAEMNRRLGTDPHTIRHWRDEGVRPSVRHFAALLKLANDLGLGHLFTD